MDSYTPHDGETAYVQTEDGPVSFTVALYSETGGGNDVFLAFRGGRSEQWAVRADDGRWFLQESGQQVWFDRETPIADPPVGSLATRVINGASLLYRVRRVEAGESYRVAHLTLVGVSSPERELQVQVSYTPADGWRWPDGERVDFTEGSSNELALGASRLTTLHTNLREKYLYYAAMALPSPHSAPGGHAVAMALREEFAELLFLAETGLLPEQSQEGYELYRDSLHSQAQPLSPQEN